MGHCASSPVSLTQLSGHNGIVEDLAFHPTRRSSRRPAAATFTFSTPMRLMSMI